MVGDHQAFALDLVDDGVTALEAGAVVFGGVDVGDERNAVATLGDNGGFEGEPIVGVDDVWFVFHEVAGDVVGVEALDVADAAEGLRVDIVEIDGFDEFGVVCAAAEFVEGV